MLGESTKALAKLKQVRQALEAESPTTFNHGDAQKMLSADSPKKNSGQRLGGFKHAFVVL